MPDVKGQGFEESAAGLTQAQHYCQSVQNLGPGKANNKDIYDYSNVHIAEDATQVPHDG